MICIRKLEKVVSGRGHIRIKQRELHAEARRKEPDRRNEAKTHRSMKCVCGFQLAL